MRVCSSSYVQVKHEASHGFPEPLCLRCIPASLTALPRVYLAHDRGESWLTSAAIKRSIMECRRL